MTRPVQFLCRPAAVTRRDFLARAFNGFGSLALGSLLLRDGARAGEIDPLAPRPPHRPRRAKHCIFLFMCGGVSQVDSFEYKPLLNELHGKPIPRLPRLA